MKSPIKCYSVRLQSLTPISTMAYKAIAFDGSTAIIPKSMVIKQDFEVQNSEAYWISAWILEQKQLQYSKKKEAWFDRHSGKMLPIYIIEKHIPAKVEAVEVQPHQELIKKI